LRKTLSAIVLTLLPGLLFAQDQLFTFALPELEGRISLGVFDSGGQLVRTLFVGAAEKDFKIGLNGLLATWDGKNDAGQAQASGTYRVRGFVVGYGVKAEGEAYHFNEWIADDTSPEISGIGAVVPGEKENFLLSGFKPSREKAGSVEAMLWRFDETTGLQTVATLPGQTGFLAADASHAAFHDRKEGRLLLYDLANPSPPRVAAGSGFSRSAFWQDRLYLATDKNELDQRDLATLAMEKTIPAPAKLEGLDANPAALMGWDASGVWLWRGEKSAAVPLKELPENLTVSAGPGETFWIAGKHAADIMVRQHAFDGDLLRQMIITEDFAGTVRVFASKTTLSFYLLLQSQTGSRQTLRGYRPAAPPVNAGAAQVDWEVFLDKTIADSRRFGFVDGQLVPDAGQSPQPSAQKIPLRANTLNAKGSDLILKAAATSSGLWLQTADGLPLLGLTGKKFFDRIVVKKGDNAESLRVFAGDGVVVAEYLVSGLGNIAEIEVGEIEIP